MADKSFFGRLQTLFSTSTIIRRSGDKGLKVVDVNKVQQGSKLASNRLIDSIDCIEQKVLLEVLQLLITMQQECNYLQTMRLWMKIQ